MVSLNQLIRFFQMDATAIEPMLNIWIKKGVIVREEEIKACAATCSGCNTGAALYYSYLS